MSVIDCLQLVLKITNNRLKFSLSGSTCKTLQASCDLTLDSTTDFKYDSTLVSTVDSTIDSTFWLYIIYTELYIRHTPKSHV